MTKKCCVVGCHSNYDSTSEYVPVYSFPSDPDELQRWIAALPFLLLQMLNRFSLCTLEQMHTIGVRLSSSFKFSDLTVKLTQSPAQKPDMDKLVFGHHCSDHMFSVEWSTEKGWGRPSIHPVCNLSLHPAAKVLHYAQEVFEGLKAYHCVDGKIRLFRPEENMKRLTSSADRACFPTFDGQELLKCISKLVSIERDWIPRERGKSLYIRPTIIGTESSLGVASSSDVLLFVITGPVGAYFPTGVKPVSLLADPKYVRSWPGGCGFAKMASNYAPTIWVQKQAVSLGYQQVLWLFGENHALAEVGTMNILVFWINEKGEKELITPPLDGTILPGVTRKSLLDLARKWGEFRVTEATVTMPDVVRALKEQRLLEMFGAGTACVVCPVERVHYQNQDYEIPTMRDGAPLTMRFLKELNDIQYGVTKHPWSYEVK